MLFRSDDVDDPYDKLKMTYCKIIILENELHVTVTSVILSMHVTRVYACLSNTYHFFCF